MLWSVEPLYAEDIESLAKRFQGIGSFSPSEAAAIGAARCGWLVQQRIPHLAMNCEWWKLVGFSGFKNRRDCAKTFRT